jgi:hypothetical protein
LRVSMRLVLSIGAVGPRPGRRRLTDDPGRVPAEETPGEHGARRHHHNIGPLYGHLYPGDMDRYTDRLDSAAQEVGKSK